MVFQDTRGSGIAKAALFQNEVSVRLRHGGEKLRVGANRPRQAVKNLLQEATIPPWERERLPLLYIGDELACVPGVGVDAFFQAGHGAEGMALTWESAGQFPFPVR
jgi:tRNA(Ile)-lysidine synthase